MAPVRLSVNTAGLPSVTSPSEATVTEGRGSAATAEVGALVKVASWPSSSVTVTLTLSVAPASANTGA